MANTIAGSVYEVDTSAFFPQLTEIVGVKVLGASTSSVTLKAGSSTGNTMFFSDASTTQLAETVEIRNTEGIYVAISGTAKILIYTRIR